MRTRRQGADYARQIMEIARQGELVRPRDLKAYGIPSVYLSRMCLSGELQRVGRGLYVLPTANVSEHHTLAEACKRVPYGVVCLLSALRFHGLTTQAPFEVWLAIGGKAWRPRVDYPTLRFVRFSARTLSMGVEQHTIEGTSVRVYCPAKTVADCFKYRSKIGLDVALEALRDCRSQKKCTNDELWQYATLCRVANVMRPYMEAVG